MKRPNDTPEAPFERTSSPLAKRPRREAPSGALAYLSKGEALLALRWDSDALNSFNTALDLDPRLHEAHFQRATTLFNLGEDEKAMKGFDKAIELRPDNANYYFTRGKHNWNLGETEKAMKDFAASCMLDSKSAEKHFAYGKTLFILEEYEEAERVFKLKVDANHYFWLGRALQMTKKYMPAAEKFREVIALNGEHARAHFYCGWMLLKSECDMEGIQEIKNAIELDAEVCQKQELLRIWAERMEQIQRARKATAVALRKETERATIAEQSLTIERFESYNKLKECMAQIRSLQEDVEALQTENEAHAKKAAEKVNDLKKKMCDRECSICLDSEVEMLFLPCRHVGACFECSDIIDQCPLCRANIEAKSKIFG